MEDFRIRYDAGSEYDPKTADKILRDLNAVREQSPALQFLSRQATNAIIAADKMRSSRVTRPMPTTPTTAWAELRLIAQLIAGNFGTKLFYCETGGFDTHANQVGGHEQVLGQVANFHRRLHDRSGSQGRRRQGDGDVLQRVWPPGAGEQFSNGTDHGAAGPMFIAGGKVKGGLHGAYPSLTDLDSGDLKYTTDFRRVYATLLDQLAERQIRWMC
jgi:uncharacterized protein (DUF1501 family)